jgi:hypothetical protein
VIPLITIHRLPPSFWHYYWSFDLAQPTPGQSPPPDPAPYFCEVIFHVARQIYPSFSGLPASLGINDIVAIAMGASASRAGNAAFEEGLPQLDLAKSQALGLTTVTLNNGIGTLTALNLYVDLGGLHNNFMQVNQTPRSSSPPVQVQLTSNLGGGLLANVTGTFQAKNHWVSFLAPATFVQPLQGEFGP